MSSVNSSSLDSIKTMSENALNSTDMLVTRSLGFLSNNYLYSIVLVFLILYAPIAAPTLGPSILGLFSNYAVKFLYIFLLSYLLSKSVKVAIATSIILVIGTLILKKLNQENFSDSEEVHSEQVHAEKVHAEQVHAEQVHAEQVHAEKVHAEQVHAEQVHAEQVHAEQVHAEQVHAEQVHAEQVHAEQERRVSFKLPQESVADEVNPVAAEANTAFANAEHTDTLKPIQLSKISTEEESQLSSEDVIDVCGSRLSSDGYSGYDKLKDFYSTL